MSKPYIIEKHPKYYSWAYNHSGRRLGAGKYPSDFLSISLIMKSVGFKFAVRNDGLVSYLIANNWTDYGSETAIEVFKWTDENIDRRWGYCGSGNKRFFYFKNKEDMLKFILRFGGESIEELDLAKDIELNK